jgi:RND family efflux transporter MFP subunit
MMHARRDLLSSTISGDEPVDYDTGAIDDPAPRGRHVARDAHGSPLNGHSAEAVETNGHATNGAGTNGTNGNGNHGNGHARHSSKANGAAAAAADVTTIERPPVNEYPARPPLELQQRRRHLPKLTSLKARVVVALLCLVVIAAAAGAAKAARTVLEKTPAVVVTTAKPAVITNQPGGVGTLVEAPDNSFTVGVNLAGIQDAIISISGVDVTNGALVNAGTPLVKIDPTLLIQNAAQFQSQLTSAQQSLTAAEQTPSSTAPGTQSQAQQVAALTVEVNFDNNLVAIAQGKTTTITAPTSGYVTGLNLQPGQVIGAGQPILELINPSTVDVSASLLLTDIQTIAPGDAADVVPTGLPGVQLTGTVLTVSAMTSAGGLDGIVVIQAQNTSPDPVPIGSQVFVHVMATQSAAVSVPAVAVMNSDLSPAVFVLRNGRAYFQPVTVGASDADRDQILTGLTAGEVVVEANMQSLTDGEKVRVLGTG